LQFYYFYKRLHLYIELATIYNWYYKWRRCRKSLKAKRCPIAFAKSKQDMASLALLEKQQYLDLYYDDASHFSLVPNVPYAWQLKEAPILLPAVRGESTSVFGLMSTTGKLVYEMFDKTLHSDLLIAFFDKFVEKIVKKTVITLDNSSLHTSKKFRQKIKEWELLDLWIYFIPPYSPELNKIEILWKKIKYEWLAFEAYTSFDKLKLGIKEVMDEFGKKCIINFL
jgi:transposase